MNRLAKALQKQASARTNEEAFDQVKHTVLTREDTRRHTHALFANAAAAQKRDRDVIEKSFIQAPAAQTSSTNLQKTASAGSNTPHLDEFLEKVAEASLTDAQRRYPELLKVANISPPRTTPLGTQARPMAKSPTTTPSTSGTQGPTAVQSSLSGGAA